LNGYVENTKILLREQGERLLITRVANVSAIDKSAYSVSLVPSEVLAEDDKENLPDLPQVKRAKQYLLGEPINVNWTAPADCTRKDWIGLYRFKANKSKLVTRIRSHGRWLGIYPDQWNGDESLAVDGASGSAGPEAPKKTGSLVFKDKKLFWKPGQYEFRYHHNGKHNAMAVSEPFEIIGEPTVTVSG
jgi:phosphatidylethanolamine N-methyltransferase